MKLVKLLREQTGMNLKDVVKALDESGDDLDAAKKWLRTNTKVKFTEASDVKEGCVGVYVHHNHQVATLVLLACNTDFTARNPAFTELANALALHITSAKPKWVSREDVPLLDLKAEKDILQEQLDKEGKKPPHILEKIIEGRLGKFYEENVLLDQKFVKDGVPIKTMISELAAQTGEAILVKTFSRLQVG